MNKRYNPTDEERDQSRRLDQEKADRQKSREDGGPRRAGQHQAENEPGRQQVGWQTDEDSRRNGVKDGLDRATRPDEEISDEP